MESEAIAEIRRTIIKPKRRYGRQINAENCKGGKLFLKFNLCSILRTFDSKAGK